MASGDSRRHYVDLTAQQALPWGSNIQDNNKELVHDDQHPGGNAARVVDMRNVLPTTYGFTSFFGEDNVPLPKLPELTDHPIIFDTQTGRRMFAALGPDGARFSFDGNTFDETYAVYPIGDTLGTSAGDTIITQNGDALSIVTSTAQLTADSLAGITLRNGQFLEVTQAVMPTNTNPLNDIVLYTGVRIADAGPDPVTASATRIATGKLRMLFPAYAKDANSAIYTEDSTQWRYYQTNPTFGVAADLPAELDQESPIYIYPIRNQTVYEPYRFSNVQDLARAMLGEPITAAARADFSTTFIYDFTNITFPVGSVITVYTRVDLTYGNAYTYTVTAADTKAGIISWIASHFYTTYNIVGDTIRVPFSIGDLTNVIAINYPQSTAVSVDTTQVLGNWVIQPNATGVAGGAALDPVQIRAGNTIQYFAINVQDIYNAFNGNISSGFHVLLDGKISMPIAYSGQWAIYRVPKNTISYVYVSDNDSLVIDRETVIPLYAATLDAAATADWVPIEPVYDTVWTGDPPVVLQADFSILFRINTGINDALGIVAYAKDGAVMTTALSTNGVIDFTALTPAGYPAQGYHGVYSAVYNHWGLPFTPQNTRIVATDPIDYPLYARYTYTAPSGLGYTNNVRAYIDMGFVPIGPSTPLTVELSAFANVQQQTTTSTGVQYLTAGDALTRDCKFSYTPSANFFSYQYAMENSTPWTYVSLRNELYLYRQGMGALLRVSNIADRVDVVYPTFANMQYIQGIARGKGRLIMWDSDNAVYRSSITDPLDFTPSVATQATVHKVDALKGDIITIVPMGDDYVIYGSASVIYAQYVGGTTVFKYTLLDDAHGIYSPEAVTQINKDLHAAFLDSGLHFVSPQGLQAVDPKVSELLLSSKVPVRLEFLQGRYLAIQASPALPTMAVETKYQVPAGKHTLLPAVHIAGRAGSFPEHNLNINITPVYDYSWAYGLTALLPYTPNGIATHQAQISAANLPEGLTLVNTSNVVTEEILWLFLIQQLSWIFNVMLVNESVRKAGKDTPQWTAFAQSIINPAPEPKPIPGLRPVYDPNAQKYVVPSWPARYAYNGLNLFRKSGKWYLVQYGSAPGSHQYITASPGPYDKIIAEVPAPPWARTPSPAGHFDTWGLYIGTPGVTIPRSIWAHVGGIGGPRISLQGATSPPPYAAADTGASYLPASINGRSILYTPQEAASVLAQAQAVLPLQGWDIPALFNLASSYVGVTNTAHLLAPVYERTLLLDITTGQWGSCDVPLRAIFDYTPVNAPTKKITEFSTAISLGYNDFARSLAGIKPDGTIVIFNDTPQNSYLTVGKLGMYESGLTRLHTVEWDALRAVGTTLSVQTSLDGVTLAATLAASDNTDGVRMNVNRAGRWFFATISGNFSVKGVAYTGSYGGRR